MNNPTFVLTLDLVCCLLSCVFLWSTLIVLLGLLKSPRRHPAAQRKMRFAVLICARNEEAVIRMPVKSIAMGKYPADRREVIVLADNCTDRTAECAWAAGATVWEKKTPSGGKGDVLAWGVERVLAHGGFDAIAVFDSDNIVADNWLDTVNDALQDGECVVTGRRHSSNAKANSIAGWYTVYWNIMNELSNRVRTNLGLSAKLTGTGFANHGGGCRVHCAVQHRRPSNSVRVRSGLCRRAACCRKIHVAPAAAVGHGRLAGGPALHAAVDLCACQTPVAQAVRHIFRNTDGHVGRVRSSFQRHNFHRQALLRSGRKQGVYVLFRRSCIRLRDGLVYRAGGYGPFAEEATPALDRHLDVSGFFARTVRRGALHARAAHAPVETHTACRLAGRKSGIMSF